MAVLQILTNKSTKLCCFMEIGSTCFCGSNLEKSFNFLERGKKYKAAQMVSLSFNFLKT